MHTAPITPINRTAEAVLISSKPSLCAAYVAGVSGAAHSKRSSAPVSRIQAQMRLSFCMRKAAGHIRPARCRILRISMKHPSRYRVAGSQSGNQVEESGNEKRLYEQKRFDVY
jgi:hypothetical protein